jgi:type I restriction enzyme, S subunit
MSFSKKSKVYPGDVIMNKIADPGATFYVEDRGQPMSLAMNLFLIRFNKKYMNSKFAYYYFLAIYSHIVSFSSGTATSTITKDAVRNLRFPLPPAIEQKAIVAKVGNLFAVCDQLEVQISQNQTHAEQLMQAVLKEAFSHNSIPQATANN